MDKQLELALVKNQIIKTKIAIGFFILYFFISLYTVYEILSRKIEITNNQALILVPLSTIFLILSEYGILRYLTDVVQGNKQYNKKYVFPITLLEITFPSVLLIIAAYLFLFPGSVYNPIDLLNTATTMIYILFIILSSLHFDFKLSVSMGLLAALQLFIITIYLIDINDDFAHAFPIILKTFYFIPFGFASGFVSRRIKRATLESLASKNILINELDSKVQERTQELQEQKEIVEEQNEEIISSMHYASRIQNAILPKLEIMDEYLKYFVMFLPKDIVAGDFYWFYTDGDEVYVAVADCTGHGVPGAMVSVVCANALNKTVKELGLKEPGEILKKCREIVIETLDEGQSEVQDGMDISFTKLNIKSLKLSYAGAHNNLYRITTIDGELEEKDIYNEKYMLVQYKGDNQSIGKSPIVREFTQYDVQLLKGDHIYMTTDGYPDQFGGPNDKKFRYKPFRQMLLDFHEESLENQKIKLDESFLSWKGKRNQIDDVCVMGIEV